VRKQQLKVIVNTFDERKARQLSRLFAQNDTWQVPTLLIQYTYAFVDPYELHDSPGVRYVPPSAIKSWIERLNAFVGVVTTATWKRRNAAMSLNFMSSG
jgi:hypothetical protein